MAPHRAVTVSFDDFVTAVSRILDMKRPPRGSTVPKDTLLSPHQDGIFVETSALSSLVIADAAWMEKVAVDARKLIELCKTLKTLGAMGKSIQVHTADRKLYLKLLTTTLSMPTI